LQPDYIACISFFSSKPLSYCDNGSVIFNNDSNLEKFKHHIASRGQDRRYHHFHTGVNSGLGSFKAAILRPKLTALDEEISHRQHEVTTYTNFLNQARISPILRIEVYNPNAWAQYTIKIMYCEHVQEQLKVQGIPNAVYYPMPLNKQPAVLDSLAQLPVGDTVAQKVISLPMHPYLNDDDIAKIVTAIRGGVC